MRSSFSGYYPPTEDDFSKLWQECLFAFDANVILNLYRYSPETRDEMLRLLENLSDRLWMPYQAALEYQRNRLTVVAEQLRGCRQMIEQVEDFRKNLESIRQHPHIRNIENVRQTLTGLKSTIEDEVERQEKLFKDDGIRGQVTKLFDGKIGEDFLEEELQKIYKEGKRRYSEQVPPGFSDTKKDTERRKFGDLIIWKQIIKKAKDAKCSLVLITDDKKEDWWWHQAGRTIGPRPELRQEMQSKADVDFYMYSAQQFMKQAEAYLNETVKQEAIEEARSVRHLNERRRMRMRALERRRGSPGRYPRDEVARILERTMIRHGVPEDIVLGRPLYAVLPVATTPDDIVDIVESTTRDIPFLEDDIPDILRELSRELEIPFHILMDRHVFNKVNRREDVQTYESFRHLNSLDIWPQDDDDQSER